MAIHVAGQNSSVGATLLNMAVFGAAISYVLQMFSYVLLRFHFPFLPRPFRSPLGWVGALLAMSIALITLVSLFAIREYRPSVIGTALWFALGLVYFAVSGRNHLVLAPEEQFAEEARSSLWDSTATH